MNEMSADAKYERRGAEMVVRQDPGGAKELKRMNKGKNGQAVRVWRCVDLLHHRGQDDVRFVVRVVAGMVREMMRDGMVTAKAPGKSTIQQRVKTVKLDISGDAARATMHDRLTGRLLCGVRMAIDSTGLDHSVKSRWIEVKWDVKNTFGFTKLHILIDVDAKRILSARATDEKGGDAPQFTGMVSDWTDALDTAAAEAGVGDIRAENREDMAARDAMRHETDRASRDAVEDAAGDDVAMAGIMACEVAAAIDGVAGDDIAVWTKESAGGGVGGSSRDEAAASALSRMASAAAASVEQDARPSAAEKVAAKRKAAGSAAAVATTTTTLTATDQDDYDGMIDRAVECIATYDPDTDGDGSSGEIFADGAYGTYEAFEYCNQQEIRAHCKVAKNSTTGGGDARANAVRSQLGGGADARHTNGISEERRLANRKGWQKRVGYGDRWLVEIVISGLKRVLGEALYSRNRECQMQEAMLRVYAYNRLLNLLPEEAAV